MRELARFFGQVPAKVNWKDVSDREDNSKEIAGVQKNPEELFTPVINAFDLENHKFVGAHLQLFGVLVRLGKTQNENDEVGSASDAEPEEVEGDLHVVGRVVLPWAVLGDAEFHVPGQKQGSKNLKQLESVKSRQQGYKGFDYNEHDVTNLNEFGHSSHQVPAFVYCLNNRRNLYLDVDVVA